MSLTNDQITAQNFKDFYTQIKPFLGGMPEILANKFNRSDLYSTSEKIIGQWIDGKPLYQKTLTDFSQTYSQNTEYDISVGSNIDKLMVQSGCIDIGTGNALLPLNCIIGGNESSSVYCFPSIVNHTATLKLKSLGWNFIGYVITIQYTKTTDSPVSIGSDTDYSTTEKIVGTWIDGKPLYQKTFSGTWALAINETAVVGSISNVSSFIKYDGSGFVTGYSNEVRTLDGLMGFAYMDTVSGNISIKSLNGAVTWKSVTVQYTKTTD